ncbi:glutathione S-transferase family protein [Paraburkholderia bonniea]|uniref:glutathione S-transferase family protein n=1 Tax=Paraburkholderia bonniea TaxID=2152891 RepID=UPI00129238DE|nr:glutathione S-transferase family protein [Paraburkholderia bonniea]WJF90497.1 glutathione S-transferase family protein [Paraburkholderia bonniea]WJF93812.1 glutathione S-transferase family protein [Paraburkholderia bonniea]
MKLVIGDKNYSSWSMRAWLLFKHFDLPFEEIPIELHEAHSKDAILAYSPSGRVPCLLGDDGLHVWDSLAIAETLAERFPQHALWPRDARQRGHARSISAEMHSGFTDLRANMWMDIRGAFPGQGATPGALADISRIDAIWCACLDEHGGPFLFGEFGIADAMYAPVVMRFNTWQPALSATAAAYARRITALPAVAAWISDAQRESHHLSHDDIGV